MALLRGRARLGALTLAYPHTLPFPSWGTCHQHDSHLFSLALLPEHNMEDEGKRNMCPAHFFRRIFQDTSSRHVDSSLPPTPARVSCTVADEQHART